MASSTQVYLQVLRAEALPPAHYRGLSLACVRVQPGGARSPYAERSSKAIWNWQTELAAKDLASAVVVIELWDYNLTSAQRDTLMGFCALDLGAITKRPREIAIGLAPEGAGRLVVSIRASQDGPYVGAAARPADAPRLVAPEGYGFERDRLVKLDQRNPLLSTANLF